MVQVIEHVDIDYMVPKARVARLQTLEEDLRMVLSQYTGDERTLEVFRSTKLSRYIEQVSPSNVEKAAYKYYVEMLDRARRMLPSEGQPIYHAYQVVVVARDLHLAAAAVLRGEPVPENELVTVGDPLVAKAVELLRERGVTGIAQSLRLLGLETAYAYVKQAGVTLSVADVAVALDLELLDSFRRACSVVRDLPGEAATCSRLDVLSARVALNATSMRLSEKLRRVVAEHLATYKVRERVLAYAVEAGDYDAATRALMDTPYGRPSEKLPLLEGFTARVRKYSRRMARSAFSAYPLHVGLLAALLELVLLDVEDVTTIAVAAFSRMPRDVLMEMVSV